MRRPCRISGIKERLSVSFERSLPMLPAGPGAQQDRCNKEPLFAEDLGHNSCPAERTYLDRATDRPRPLDLTGNTGRTQRPQESWRLRYSKAETDPRSHVRPSPVPPRAPAGLRRHRFPRSHGPPGRKVNRQWLTLRSRADPSSNHMIRRRDQLPAFQPEPSDVQAKRRTNPNAAESLAIPETAGPARRRPFCPDLRCPSLWASRAQIPTVAWTQPRERLRPMVKASLSGDPSGNSIPLSEPTSIEGPNEPETRRNPREPRREADWQEGTACPISR
jgi:hypothetical protein